MQKNKEMNPTYKLCVVGILCALEIVLSRVAAINVFPWLKISFGFIPIAICAILTGPAWTVMMAVVCDIIGATLFPTGTFYWGFTLVAAVDGLIYGLFLYKQKNHLLRCLLCTLTVTIICNIVLNTIFLVRTGYIVGPENEAFMSIFWTRVGKNMAQFVVNGFILFGIWKTLDRIPARLRKL